MRRLPPLNAVKAFEAAARLGSIQQAADELSVTHGAVSRQVKQLENWLGVGLFDRSRRALSLTAQGQLYRQAASAALDLVQEATLNTRQHRPAKVLAVATTHSLASKWLIPRLPEFSSRHPQIEVWLTLSRQLTDFNGPSADIALRCGQGPWPGWHCIGLREDSLVAVCAPRLLSSESRLEKPADLARFPLLHDQDPGAQWHRWIDAHGVKGVDVDRGPRYSSADVLIQAAINGQGVALVPRMLVADDIREQRLLQPLPQSLALGIWLWLVMPPQSREQPNLVAFCEWLVQETRKR